MGEVAEEVKALGRKATTLKADVSKRDDVVAVTRACGRRSTGQARITDGGLVYR